MREIEDVTSEVASFEGFPVEQNEPIDSLSNEQLCDRGAEGTAANDGDGARTQRSGQSRTGDEPLTMPVGYIDVVDGATKG